jgi:hypothetical protein
MKNEKMSFKKRGEGGYDPAGPLIRLLNPSGTFTPFAKVLLVSESTYKIMLSKYTAPFIKIRKK